MSFAVYLCHEAVVVLLSEYIHIDNYLIKECFVFCGSFIISFCIAGMISLHTRTAKVVFDLNGEK